MPHDIAIVGISCRFPQAANPEQFWKLLEEGRCAIREVPPERWSTADIYDEDPAAPGKANTKWGGFLDDPGGFDNEFFRMSAEESTYVDPQQRLILELGWEALEDACIPPDSLSGGRIGVYVGISHNDYERIIYRRSEDITRFHGTGSYQAVAANRLSYFLNLTGPSVAVDSACSSALSAIHVACGALRQQELDVGLVGAVTYHLTPDETIGLTKGQLLSPQGRCLPFDKRADGYVRGEGGGVLVLKRLEDAVRDSDRIYGVVKGTAINHNGKSNGLSAPNGRALQAVMERGLQSADLPSKAVTFLETHGTGTKLGDQIELSAVRQVYETAASAMLLGAAKANIGHLETSSGMASVIKILLAMKNEYIPANIYPSEPQLLPLPENSRLTFPVTGMPWHANEYGRVGAITSYGFGGANGHVIISQRPALAEKSDDKAIQTAGFRLLCLSAREPEALKQLVSNYVACLDSEAASVDDLCYAANVGRTHFEWRSAIVFRTIDDLRQRLVELRLKEGVGQLAERQPRIAFRFDRFVSAPESFVTLLCGQHAIFRQTFEQCCASIGKLIDRHSNVACEFDGRRFSGFALQYSMARLLVSWGLRPEAIDGVGDGCVTAAAFAGAVDVDQALRILAGEQFELLVRKASIPILSSQGAPVTEEALANGTYFTDRNAESIDHTETLAHHYVQLGSRCFPQLHTEDGETLLATVNEDEAKEALLGVVANAYCRGMKIDWAAFYAGQTHRKVGLPTYPFQRKTLWFSGSTGAAKTAGEVNAAQLRLEDNEPLSVDTAVGARSLEMVAWLRDYATRRLDSRLMDERRCIPPNVVLDLGNAGLLGLLVPKQWGGEELSMRDAVHVFEQLGAIDITLASFLGVHNVLGVLPILRSGNELLKEYFLPRLATGRLLGAFAVTEPGAGSNPRAIGSTAHPASDGRLRLNGRKIWIGNASWSGALSTFVNEYDADGIYRGVSGFLTTPDTEGMRQGPEALTMGVRAMVQNEVIFEDALVCEQDRLGAAGTGLEIAAETFDVGRLGIGALTVGAMKRCLQLMQRYASRRQISTGLLAENGVYTEKLHVIVARVEMVQTWVYSLASIRDKGAAIPSEACAIAKITGTEWLWDTVDTTMQFMGGRGYIEANLVPQMFRDARLLRIFEGPSEALLAHVGSSYVKGRSQLLTFIEDQFDHPCTHQVIGRLKELEVQMERVRRESMPVDQAARLHQRAGQVLCAAALLASAGAYVHGHERALVLDWARQDFDDSVQQLRALLDEPMRIDASRIHAHANALARDVGHVDQLGAVGEDASIDELLRPMPLLDKEKNSSRSPSVANRVAAKHVEQPSQSAKVERQAVSKDVRDIVLKIVAGKLHTPTMDLEPDRPFFEYGIDSVDAVSIAQEVEDETGRSLDPTVLWNYPTLNELLDYLVPEHASAPSPVHTADKSTPKPQFIAQSGSQLLDDLKKELADD